MASIYFHIPFCKKACHYCNFHFSTNLKNKDFLIDSIIKELIMRKNELNNQLVDSVYFGGGSPSILEINDIRKLIENVFLNFHLNEKLEITLEVNPDDIKGDEYLDLYKNIGINRISIGVQSFSNEDLKLINRSHNSSQALNVIEKVRKKYENFSLDLIYGIPNTDLKGWFKNIDIALSFLPKHISAYSLTIEPGTVLYNWIKKNKVIPLDENIVLDQFNYLTSSLEEKGYNHYEISSFAKPGYYSKHNTSYWKGINYLGLGPSAHSFDGEIRSWNVSNNNQYIKSIEKNTLPIQRENLTKVDKYNEYIMTGLRTIWGVSIQKIKKDFGDNFFSLLEQNVEKHISRKNLFWEKGVLKTSKKGRFLIDGIISDLFLINK